jgi:hypothetical protein
VAHRSWISSAAVGDRLTKQRFEQGSASSMVA